MNTKKLEELCLSILEDDGWDSSDVDELAKKTMKLIHAYESLQKRYKRASARIDGVITHALGKGLYDAIKEEYTIKEGEKK